MATQMSAQEFLELKQRREARRGLTSTPEPVNDSGEEYGTFGGTLGSSIEAGWDAYVAASAPDEHSQYTKRKLGKSLEEANKHMAKADAVTQTAAGIARYLPAIAPTLTGTPMGIAAGAAIGSQITAADSLVEQARQGKEGSMAAAQGAGLVQAGLDLATGGAARLAKTPVKRFFAERAGDAVSGAGGQAAINVSADKDATDNILEAAALSAAAGGTLDLGMSGLKRLNPWGEQAVRDAGAAEDQVGRVLPEEFKNSAIDQEDKIFNLTEKLKGSKSREEAESTAGEIVDEGVIGGTNAAALAAIRKFEGGELVPHAFDVDVAEGLSGSGPTRNLAKLFGISKEDIKKSGNATLDARSRLLGEDIEGDNTRATDEAAFKKFYDGRITDINNVFKDNADFAADLKKKYEREDRSSAEYEAVEDLGIALRKLRDGAKSGSEDLISENAQKALSRATELGVLKDLKGFSGKAGEFDPVHDIRARRIFDQIAHRRLPGVSNITPDPRAKGTGQAGPEPFDAVPLSRTGKTLASLVRPKASQKKLKAMKEKSKELTTALSGTPRKPVGKPSDEPTPTVQEVLAEAPAATQARVEKVVEDLGTPSDSQSLFDRAKSLGAEDIPYRTVRDGGGKLIEDSGSSNIINLGGRMITLMPMGDHKVPFYLSTGKGGKADVPDGKWYPFFGVGEDGWINKTGGKDMTTYYGSDALKKKAEELDKWIGDVRKDDSIPKVARTGSHIDAINSSFPDATSNGNPDTLVKVRKNIDKIVNSLSESAKTTRTRSSDLAGKPKPVSKSEEVVEEVPAPKDTLRTPTDQGKTLAEQRGLAQERQTLQDVLKRDKGASDEEASAFLDSLGDIRNNAREGGYAKNTEKYVKDKFDEVQAAKREEGGSKVRTLEERLEEQRILREDRHKAADERSAKLRAEAKQRQDAANKAKQDAADFEDGKAKDHVISAKQDIDFEEIGLGPRLKEFMNTPNRTMAHATKLIKDAETLIEKLSKGDKEALQKSLRKGYNGEQVVMEAHFKEQFAKVKQARERREAERKELEAEVAEQNRILKERQNEAAKAGEESKVADDELEAAKEAPESSAKEIEEVVSTIPPEALPAAADAALRTMADTGDDQVVNAVIKEMESEGMKKEAAIVKKYKTLLKRVAERRGVMASTGKVDERYLLSQEEYADLRQDYSGTRFGSHVGSMGKDLSASIFGWSDKLANMGLPKKSILDAFMSKRREAKKEGRRVVEPSGKFRGRIAPGRK